MLVNDTCDELLIYLSSKSEFICECDCKYARVDTTDMPGLICNRDFNEMLELLFLDWMAVSMYG